MVGSVSTPHVMNKKSIKAFAGKLIASAISRLARLITSRTLPGSVSEWRSVDYTFAQFAEDILVIRALESLGITEKAYYVDVGAYHPLMYSNTVRLHWQGWKGINIDAQADHIANFNRERPYDINLQYAVTERSGFADFFCYDSGTTGRVADPDGGDSTSILGEELRETISVPTEPLATLLRRHAPHDQLFGFLSIDCEGSDLEVLRSNDWDQFTPWVIAIEDHTKEGNTEIDDFLKARGYHLWAMAHVTKIFVREIKGRNEEP